MERLYITKAFLDMRDGFTVRNKKKQQIYQIKPTKLLALDDYILQDAAGNDLVRMYKEIQAQTIYFHLEQDGERLLTISTNKGFKTTGFSIDTQNMVTKDNKTKTVYELYQAETKIASIQLKLFRPKKRM